MSNEDDRFRKMVEHSQDWFWEFDENACFTYVSPQIQNLLGYDPGELFGLNAFDLMDADEAERVHEHFDPIAKKYLPFNNLININRHKDGHEVVIESSATPIFDEDGQFRGYRGIDRDITVRKAMEDNYRRLASLTSDYVHCCTRSEKSQFRIQWVDGAVNSISGYTVEDVFKLGCFLPLVHPDDQQPVSDYLLSLVPGDRKSIEFRIVTQQKEIRWVSEKSQCETGSSEREFILLGAVTDITERKTNEVALLAATQVSEAANRAKGLFLAKVSHEIRTPMTSIIGFGELLEDTELDPEQQKYLAAINAAGSDLTLLIDDVLDLSKVDAGELAIKSEDFSLRDFISKMASLQERQAAVKNLSLSVRIDTEVPEVLIGDSLRIQQVLLNLVGNAIKFTEKGAVGIEVSLIEETNVRVLLDVAIKDTGIGIPSGQLEKIFEPFAQAPGVNSQNYGGSGLGLSISRSLAALMGGSLRVESQVGTGSTFHFILPLKRKNGPVAKKSLAESEVPLWKGPTLNVLLAEDNPVNTQFIKTILENLGHKVTPAVNGKVAIDLFKVNAFDIVLMDIQMPVMDGADALSILRELEQLSGRPLTVIALTAFALIGDQEKYLEMGFDGYLSKPFTTRALVDEMVRVLPCAASPAADI